MKTLLIRLAVVAVVAAGATAAIMVIRAAMFGQASIREGEPYSFLFDELGAPERLAGALRLAAAPGGEAGPAGGRVEPTLHRYIQEVFPELHDAVDRESVADRSLLYRWSGSDPALRPILITAHMDTGHWSPSAITQGEPSRHAGAVEGGYIWGRGTMDGVGPMFGILEAAEALVESGFSPRRTVLFAFAHDGASSEATGDRQMAGLLESRGTSPIWVLGEGLFLVRGMIPGLRDPVGMIGVAEKGSLELTLIVEADDGDPAMPPRRSALGVLTQALDRVEREGFSPRIRGPARELLLRLGPEMDPGTRMLVANQWLLERPLARALSESPLMNAALRTTVAPTGLRRVRTPGGVRDEVSVSLRLSLAPWDRPDSAAERVRAVVSDLDVRVEGPPSSPPAEVPSAVYSSDSEGFRLVAEAIHRVFPDVVGTAPGLSVRRTGTSRYASVADHIYGFVPLRADEETLASIGSVTERVRIGVYLDAVRFYGELLHRASER